jgi:glycerol-3-phosphate dehydrogenase
LQTVLRYWDGQTDDAALTRAVVHAAQRLGCELSMPATFAGAELHADGATIHFTVNGAPQTVQTRVLVNAAGPWAGEVLKQVQPAQIPRPVELVQGTHIVLQGETSRGIYYVEAPQDGRAVFVMPWHGKTLVGTTEVPYCGPPEDVRPLPSEVTYLVDVARHYFPRFREPGADHVQASFAGLRVLPKENTRAFNRSRETMFDLDRPRKPRVLTIYGGKLTGWRATAEQVIARVRSSLPERPRRADTREIELTPVS